MRPTGRSRSIYHTPVSPKVLFLDLSGSFEGYGVRSILESEVLTSNIKENTLEAEEMSWKSPVSQNAIFLYNNSLQIHKRLPNVHLWPDIQGQLISMEAVPVQYFNLQPNLHENPVHVNLLGNSVQSSSLDTTRLVFPFQSAVKGHT